MPTSTEASFYLLSILEFDVGDERVKLYGAIKVSTTEGLCFILSDKMQFDPTLLPAGDVTKSISHPLGLKGIVLSDLDVDARIYKENNEAVVDLKLKAAARFTDVALSHLQLIGAIIIDKRTRLALVALEVVNPQGQRQEPLTLAQFVRSVIGGSCEWADEVAGQFAFQKGYMYYLSGSDNYVYNSQNFSRGYHLSATLQIFQKYDFEINLSVDEQNAITLKGTYLNEIDFDFARLKAISLQISTATNAYFRINATAIIFNEQFEVGANYKNSAFIGSVSSEGVTVVFSWTQGSGANGGFAIVAINGLGFININLIENFFKVLKEMTTGGCEAILRDWLGGMSVTKLTPKLNGRPSKQGSKMHIPLILAYEIYMDNSRIAGADIDFTAIMDIPNGVKDIPRAVGQSIIDSTAEIAIDILSNADTYKAIAIEVTKRVGVLALARFICRAVEQGLKELALSLVGAAAEFAAQTLAEALELAAAVIGALLLVLGPLLAILDKIFGDGEREEAEKKLREIRDYIEKVDAKITEIKNKITIQSLVTNINEQNQFVADIVRQSNISGELEPGISLRCNFAMLTGEPGDAAGEIFPQTPENTNQAFPLVKNWSDIPGNSQYRLNAKVQSVLSGFRFINSENNNISTAISQLRSFDNAAARELADKLQEFKGYNDNGITTNWIYAQTSFPGNFVIGKNRIGINTRI